MLVILNHFQFKPMKKYIISPITNYCEEEELFYTKVGLDEIGMPLHYNVWGTTAIESRRRADQLRIILSNQQTINHSSLI